VKQLFLLIGLLFINTLISAQAGGENCATATAIPSIPFIGVGNTSAAVDDYFASCQDYPNSGGAKDHVYTFTTGSNAMYLDFNLCMAITDYDCQLYVYESTCTGTPIACQEDGCQSPAFTANYNSRITGQLVQANTTYYVVIDGYDGGAAGNYQLNILESIGLSPPDSTNLPLVIINTAGQSIVDEPKINVTMKIIYNGPTTMTHFTDPANVYNGTAGIEIRGSYSASLPQKPYGVETRDILGFNNNVSLFGMPIENDWILLANYNDKTFLRNILAAKLFSEMGHYASRTQLCEVVIDSLYNGVYVFLEKLKIDDGRINISKTDSLDNTGDSLTGGYVFKIDYYNNNDSWLSNYNNPNYPTSDVRFVYDTPDELAITNAQKNYLQTKVNTFENDLWGSNFDDPILGYKQHIDVTSFIDYFIVNEFARNVDGFKKSRRFHKNKNSKDSLIYAGPVWDFDWAYKDHSSSMLNGSGWRHSYSGASDVKPPGWYMRLIQDTTFANDLNCRYFHFRNTILDTTYLFNYIDSMGALLSGASSRHYDRWPILGVNVGTPEIGPQPTTYAGEIVKFKGWILERLTWLDANMPGNSINCGVILGTTKQIEQQPYLAVYPNPTSSLLNIYVSKPIQQINVVDVTGKHILHLGHIHEKSIQLQTSELKGIYILQIDLENGKQLRSKFIAN
jgi:hypothetical protein